MVNSELCTCLQSSKCVMCYTPPLRVTTYWIYCNHNSSQIAFKYMHYRPAQHSSPGASLPQLSTSQREATKKRSLCMTHPEDNLIGWNALRWDWHHIMCYSIIYLFVVGPWSWPILINLEHKHKYSKIKGIFVAVCVLHRLVNFAINYI